MSQRVTLLVCLSSPVQLTRWTEYSFFSLINPIAPVKNVKILSTQSQSRALIQVQNDQLAQLVIDRLHGRSSQYGKITVVYFNQQWPHGSSDAEYSPVASMRLDENANPSRQPPALKVFQQQEDAYARLGSNFQAQQIYVTSESDGTSNNPPVPRLQASSADGLTLFCGRDATELTHSQLPTIAKITHHDATALKQNKVIRIFRRFGRIVDIAFDRQRIFWAIEYRSDREVSKVINAVVSDKLYGYAIIETEQKQSEAPCINKSMAKPISSESNGSTALSAGCILVYLTDKYIEIEELCFFVSRVFIPLTIRQCLEPKTHNRCFAVEFEFVFQAAQALIVLSQQTGRFKCSRVEFA